MTLRRVWVLIQKEWKEAFNAPMPYVVMALFCLVAGGGWVRGLFLGGQASLENLFSMMPWLAAIFVPAMTLRLFAEEYRSGTIEVLVALPLREEEIVLAKYGAALAFWGTLLGMTLFYAGLLVALGRPDMGQWVGGYLGLLLVGAFFSAWGLWASALSRSSVIAFLVGFLFCFFFYAVGEAAQFVPGGAGAVMAFLSVDRHVENFQRGVVDTRDVLFFLSGTAAALTGTWVTFRARRQMPWRGRWLWALALGVAGLIAIHWLGNNFFWRWDGTSDKRYSLAAATIQQIRALPKVARARFYVTPDLPEPYQTQTRYIRDLLNECRAVSKGKFSVETLFPDGSDAQNRELQRLHIYPARFTQVGADQYQVREGFMAVSLHMGEKEEVLPFLSDVSRMEYELASRLRVMTRKEKKNLFFISNHNEVSPNFIKEGPAARLFEEFHVEPTRLAAEDSGMKAHAVFLLGPQNKLTPEELSVLDQYISSGVPVVIGLNRRVVMPTTFRSIAQDTGLENFLDHYGVHIERDFVMDEQCGNIALASRQGTFLVKYFPFVMATDLLRNHPTLSRLDVLGFPFSSALTSTVAPDSGLRFTVLARSSGQSWVWPGLYNVDPPNLQSQMKTEPPAAFLDAGRKKDLGPFALAALVEGSTVTFRDPRRPVRHARLVVFGTSFFANPQVPNPEGNALFLLSLAQWLTEESDIVAIPPKGPPFRPLKPLPSWKRDLVKGVGYFFLPGLIAIAGLWRWQSRRK